MTALISQCNKCEMHGQNQKHWYVEYTGTNLTNNCDEEELRNGSVTVGK